MHLYDFLNQHKSDIIATDRIMDKNVLNCKYLKSCHLHFIKETDRLISYLTCLKITDNLMAIWIYNK